jgi:hypothetical protein
MIFISNDLKFHSAFHAIAAWTRELCCPDRTAANPFIPATKTITYPREIRLWLFRK